MKVQTPVICIIASLLMLMVVTLVTATPLTQPYSPPVPSWVTTQAPQPGMIEPGTIITIDVYDASLNMQKVTRNLMIGGYWVNADNQPLYYCFLVLDSSTVFILNRETVESLPHF